MSIEREAQALWEAGQNTAEYIVQVSAAISLKRIAGALEEMAKHPIAKVVQTGLNADDPHTLSRGRLSTTVAPPPDDLPPCRARLAGLAITVSLLEGELTLLVAGATRLRAELTQASRAQAQLKTRISEEGESIPATRTDRLVVGVDRDREIDA
jgi:hypothetical protein